METPTKSPPITPSNLTDELKGKIQFDYESGISKNEIDAKFNLTDR